jgi:hypothetical protein
MGANTMLSIDHPQQKDGARTPPNSSAHCLAPSAWKPSRAPGPLAHAVCGEISTGVAAGHSRRYAISFAINKLAVGPAIAITAGMGIIQLFLTFLVDGLRTALAAALLIGWPIFPGSCGAVSQQAGVTSNVDEIVVPCAPVEIRFRFEESGLTPRADRTFDPRSSTRRTTDDAEGTDQ